MANVKLKTEHKINNAALTESFAALEAVVKKDAIDLLRIDNDIRTVQDKIKALKFDAILTSSEIDITDGVLIYDFTKKQIMVTDGDAALVALLKAPAKIRKEVHTLWLTELMSQIAKDYEEAKEQA